MYSLRHLVIESLRTMSFEVKEELGVSTEREAVEIALDLIVFRKELYKGHTKIWWCRGDRPVAPTVRRPAHPKLGVFRI